MAGKFKIPFEIFRNVKGTETCIVKWIDYLGNKGKNLRKDH